MNTPKFDPFKDLPHCDICHAVTTGILIEREESTLFATIHFACLASFRATRRADFKGTFPNERYTPYDQFWTSWTEQASCSNATTMIRNLRAEDKKT